MSSISLSFIGICCQRIGDSLNNDKSVNFKKSPNKQIIIAALSHPTEIRRHFYSIFLHLLLFFSVPLCHYLDVAGSDVTTIYWNRPCNIVHINAHWVKTADINKDGWVVLEVSPQLQIPAWTDGSHWLCSSDWETAMMWSCHLTYCCLPTYRLLFMKF